MVEPAERDAALAAALAAHGTDASPLEDVLEPPPPPLPLRSEAPPPGDLAFEPEAGAPEDQPPADEEPALPAASSGTPGETYYELLGVSPQASREQIEKAHRFCLDMYKDGALATYSLLDASDAEAARRRISLAYETLSDAVKRHAYDLSLGLTPSVVPASPFSLPAEAGAFAPVPAPGAPLPEGPLTGAELRRIRESRGIALREVASSTKIGLRFLEYIEEDRFALLPPAVYLRGFLNEYARVLGLDVRRATEAYMSRLGRRD
jgi:hypothetical protein